MKILFTYRRKIDGAKPIKLYGGILVLNNKIKQLEIEILGLGRLKWKVYINDKYNKALKCFWHNRKTVEHYTTYLKMAIH